MEYKVVIAAIGGLLASAAQAIPPDFKQRADSFLASSYAAGGPGAAVVVSEHGKIVYSGQAGMADIAAKRRITQTSVFRLGSITKQFASAVVLQLVQEGRLKLTDPIGKYLKDYPNGSNITVREILNHTSGIQDYTEIEGFMVEDNTDKPYTTAQLLALFKDLPAVSKPGEKWAYNNSGYILVGALIEAVTGNSWASEVDRRIARPLGLKSIQYGINERSNPLMATGYTAGEDKSVKPAIKIDMTVPGAAGALDGDVGDLARWADALHHGKVVSAPLYAEMIAPTKLPDGHLENYGYGLAPGTLSDAPTIGHSGGIFGFLTDSLYFPKEDLFIAAFANSDSPETSPTVVVRRLGALAIGLPFPTFTEQKLDPQAVTPWLGTYAYASAQRTLELIDGKLVSARVGGSGLPLIAVGNNTYSFGSQSFGWLVLARDTAGKPIVEFHGNGETKGDVGTWTGPPPAKAPEVQVSRATLDSYVGTYTTPIGKAKIAVDGQKHLTVQLEGQPPFAMRALAQDRFSVEMVKAEVKFVVTAGKVSGLTIEQGGKTLPGKRD
ncbi:MAG: serine hydrolase [Sphingomonas sp.]|nr:serine hydrolase [Sphingomonas sp.]